MKHMGLFHFFLHDNARNSLQSFHRYSEKERGCRSEVGASYFFVIDLFLLPWGQWSLKVLFVFALCGVHSNVLPFFHLLP